MAEETQHIELYKKYRPNRWEDLIGQEKVARSLQAAVATNKVPTAYLFSGQRGCGKTTAALILAKAINCEHPVKGNPCNQCDTCISIDEGTQPGVTYVSAAQNSGVDSIRDMVSKARLQMPIKRQVFILDEVHNLATGKGFEALLIPLEEKTMPSLFIFCTTEIDKIPRTILSRTQQRKFRLVDSDALFDHVKAISHKEGFDLDDEALEYAVKCGKGSVRDTLTALESISSNLDMTDSRNAEVDFITAISNRSVMETFTVISEANEDGIDFRDFTEDVFEDLRDLLLLSKGCDSSLVGPIPFQETESIVKGFFGAKGILLAMKELGESITQMSSGGDPRILLEVASMRILSMLSKISKIA